MAFSYYDRLPLRDQAIYRKSDAIKDLPIADAAALRPFVERIAAGLAADDRGAVQRASRALVAALCGQLEVPPVILRVLARRPTSATEELHGFYERDDETPAVLRVWMRTAANERPVAFRTYLRTLMHELCHHVDYERLGLADSFHTEGFFRRESSLVRQLAGPGRVRGQDGRVRGQNGRVGRPKVEPPPPPSPPPPPPRRGQLGLPGLE